MAYEYKIITGNPSDAEEQLNLLAADGWELVSTTSTEAIKGSLLWQVPAGLKIVLTVRREKDS